jgi:carboxyl-terminal processing protease
MDVHSMVSVITRRFRLGLVASVGFVAACSGPAPMDAPTPADAQDAAVAEPAMPERAFPRSEAENLFSHGYSVIAERYIDPVNLRDIGIAGLAGLGHLDPLIQVERVGSSLEVSREGKVLGAFTLPAKDDPAGWGLLTANVFGLVRDTSTPLLNAAPEALYKAVFDGALEHLDPFSRYADAQEARLNRGARNGFGGIGIMYDITDGGVVITRVMPGTPASEAGMREGDVILSVDGRSTVNASRADIREWLRGPTSSSVSLVLKGADPASRRTLSVERALIVMPTVEYKMEGDVAFITVSSFNQRTTTAVAEAISEAEREMGDRLKGIVLDLRGNPGGLLDQAVTMSDLFLERGPIVSTRGRHPDARQFYAATSGDLTGGLPLVVMVDGDSASAAEIVAAALQDSGRAVVIGTTSYGKGTVQTVLQMPNGGEMTLTWSRFHSPSGYVLHGLGVRPIACTSGVGEAPGQAENVLAQVGHDERLLAAQLAMWRATDHRDDARRDALRGGCPAEHHLHAAIDEAVALKLLANHALYQRALDLTAPTQAAAGR